jgi:phosphate-selective porin OprO and OprP
VATALPPRPQFRSVPGGGRPHGFIVSCASALALWSSATTAAAQDLGPAGAREPAADHAPPLEAPEPPADAAADDVESVTAADAPPADARRTETTDDARKDGARTTEPAQATAAPAEEPAPAVSVRYQDHALRFESSDGNFGAQIQHRLQFRYAWPFDADPRTLEDLDERTSSFMVRRARFKLRGHAFRPWLAWYLQYDWSQPVLRDFSGEISRFPWFRLLVGRRKVFFNDERVASSGAQQFVNRSIVNDVVTVDRQQGIQVFGNLFPGSFADMTYYVGVFAGRGVGERLNDDLWMMHTARLQWNVLGGEMEFAQSDVEHHAAPVVNLAAAGATNISDCTAYETDRRSCLALPTPRSDGTAFGDPSVPGEVTPGQFRLDQLAFEFRSKWRGLYAKHEFHIKRVRDRTLPAGAPGAETTLRASLSQLGYFPHGLISAIPKPLEIAVRFAHVDPAVGVAGDLQTETSGVLNWFFSGHENKLSFEGGWLTVSQPGAPQQGQTRLRLQWDVSF